MPTPEEIAAEALEIYRRMTETPNPYREELTQFLLAGSAVNGWADQIIARWKAEYLAGAVAHDKEHPNAGQDYENYSKALIVPIDAIRKRGFKELAHLVFLHAVEASDKHCQEKGVDLHRGALYADLAITYLERKQHEMGLSWLLAAANEDLRFNRVAEIYRSFAMSDKGILGEWVTKHVQPAVPADVMAFVNAKLGKAYGGDELMKMLRSLAGKGDLNLLAGIINFKDMEGRTDYVGNSIRLTCLRDLATLFEVLLKQIGKNHADAAVKSKYTTGSPMLANMLYMMHYQQYPLTAANRHLHSEGIFRNSVQTRQDILDAIEVGFPTTKDSTNHDMVAVRTYLHGNNLSANGDTDDLAKRFLLAHRLRNETSHGFNPSDAGIVAHAEEFRTWLLQAIFYLYFWARDTGQAAI